MTAGENTSGKRIGACRETPGRGGRALGTLACVLSMALLAVWARVTASERAMQLATQAPPGSEERIVCLTRALALDPGNARARALRSGAYLLRGSYEEAQADADRASIAFSEVEFILQRAGIAQHRGNMEERLRLIESARLMQPDSPQILTQLAATLYQLGKYDKARAVAEELNERAPDNIDGLFSLGACAEAEAHPQRARLYYRQALDQVDRGTSATIATKTEISARLEKLGG